MKTEARAAAQVFRQRARRARVERQRREEEVRARVVLAVREALPRHAEAYLVGSLAWGGFGPHSDVDLVLRRVDAACALHLERTVSAIAGVEVDLLDFDSLPESFRRRIEAEGVRVHDS